MAGKYVRLDSALGMPAPAMTKAVAACTKAGDSVGISGRNMAIKQAWAA